VTALHKPYPEEADNAAVLTAKVGTLRADLARVTAERDEARTLEASCAVVRAACTSCEVE
jgi:hypothetical protein